MTVFGIHFCMDEARAIVMALPALSAVALYIKTKVGA